MKTNLLLMILVTVVSMPCWAEDDHDRHTGHSDDLLYLLQHKIAVSKLQDKFEMQSLEEQVDNLKQQGQRLKRAMPIMRSYLATPESRYPNMEIYHQSLQSRGSLLQDYTHLLVRFQQQSSTK